MGYDALQQSDNHDHHSTSSSPVGHLASPRLAPLSLYLDNHNADDGISSSDHENFNSPSSGALSQMFENLTTTTKSSYDIVEDDDYEEIEAEPRPFTKARSQNQKPSSPPSFYSPTVPVNITRPRAARPRLNEQATAAKSETTSTTSPPLPAPHPLLRTASGRSAALRHPTPDLQALQGAYVGNIEHLERTAERLSMTSSIDDAIRELHMEQKRNDSRRSSLLSSPVGEPPNISRQLSNGSSILDTNNLARAGGYSPAGFTMSPKGSMIGSGRGRSASKSSRYGTRPEPELEGRPLDSFVSTPARSLAHSILEQDEDSGTLTRPVVDLLSMDGEKPRNQQEEDRPMTSASTTTFDQAQKAFADFDGLNDIPRRHASRDRLSMAGSNYGELNDIPKMDTSRDRLSLMGVDAEKRQRRASAADRLERPQTYIDPDSNQQMVYYPAPVPMMLNLPQRLSKAPSSMARNKRRSQVLSSIPPAARQSAIWLPDVLETEDQPLADDDGIQNMEYMAQHQRATMGGRRTTTDMQHVPPQLRATAFFDLPSMNETVKVKENSAVATLDSILDASAHAPVSAFTDHAFAGHLGAEVYGRAKDRKSKSSTHLLVVDDRTKRRTSSFNNLLGFRRASSSNFSKPEELRRNTIAATDPANEDEQPDEQAAVSEDSEESEQEGEEVYYGAPTTLLAELQLRKQQQKQRTRPIGSAYPNGLHSTLLELDAVAQVEKKTRNKRRVALAWEDPSQEPEDAEDDDDDVPLAMLYNNKSRVQELNRPLGLMERREMEDNEPLSRRRDRLLGRPAQPPRAATMMNLSTQQPEDEEETLAERIRRIKGEAPDENKLPKARPVSGDFASEMMSQFGGDLMVAKDAKGKGKEIIPPSPGLEEEETLGQRRKRLQAEKEAKAKEVAAADAGRPNQNKRHSMADILQAHPTGASRVTSNSKRLSGLLAMQEKADAHKASSMLNLNAPRVQGPKAFADPHAAMRNNGYQNQWPQPQQHFSGHMGNMYNNQQMFPQPTLPYGYGNQMMPQYANPYAVQYGNGMQMGYNMPHMMMQNQYPNQMSMMDFQPLNQGQLDMVERWRQSVMH
ncbi:hypothetical protein B0O99DRAFT_502901 [Bisporella sp. PMI_857]|nr:hypothetical protein B0O99DRAFT_502901 [Bisporella sp. PMI_857]